MTKIVLLNGPPGSGKDTLGNHAADYIPYANTYKFAEAVKLGTHALYGMPGLPRDWFETTKEIPQACFDGLTPRQAYIHYSEKVVKPIFGSGLAKCLSGSLSAKIRNWHLLPTAGSGQKLSRLWTHSVKTTYCSSASMQKTGVRRLPGIRVAIFTPIC
jgi:hypothetical protein